MNTITISPNSIAGHGFIATRGSQTFTGSTAGEVLDKLTNSNPGPRQRTVVILESSQPDELFTLAQQLRLSELMDQLRAAEARNEQLQPQVRMELESLVKAELVASGERARVLAEQLGK